MPTKRFAAIEGEPLRLEVSWENYWNHLVIKYDGEQLAQFEHYRELKAPSEVELPDGRTLQVRLANAWNRRYLSIRVDGQPVPGSDGHATVLVRSASWGIAGVAALSLVFLLGVFARTWGQDISSSVIASIAGPRVVLVALYCVLGIVVRRRSRAALIGAMLLLGVDGVYSLVLPISGVGSRALFILPTFAWAIYLQMRALLALRSAP